MKSHQIPHPPAPSPSGRGGETRSETDASYRAAASKAMVQIARNLRQRETSAEAMLWAALRNRRLRDLKFRRQHPIAKTAFVADFLCYEHKLVIELDGGVHDRQLSEDTLRQQAIEETGYTIIRFKNDDVLNDLESVLIHILRACDLSPLALRERGRG